MKKSVSEYLSAIGKCGGSKRTPKKLAAIAQNARGARRVRECLVCGWKGKKRKAGQCPKCESKVD